MNFDGKSYWEKMLLGDMLNQGLKLYPEYKQFLLNKYGNDLMWSNKAKRCNFMNRIIFIPRKLIMKLKFYLLGPLGNKLLIMSLLLVILLFCINLISYLK